MDEKDISGVKTLLFRGIERVSRQTEGQAAACFNRLTGDQLGERLDYLPRKEGMSVDIGQNKLQ